MGSCLSHYLSDRERPVTVVQRDWGLQDHTSHSFVLLLKGQKWGWGWGWALECPGCLVLERMTVLWILALSGNYISIPLSMLFGNTYHKFNLVNSQAIFFLPVQFNTIQICQQVICLSARLLEAKCESSVAKWLFLTWNKFPISYLAMMHVYNWP